MGKRTQIIVNLKVMDKQNNNIIEREVLEKGAKNENL